MNRAKLGLRYVVGAALCLAAASPVLADDATPSADQAPVTALWAGAAFKPHVAAGYAGGLWAPTGNLDSSGWLLRGEYLYVGYNFSSTAAVGGSASGQLNRADAQVGYQVVNSGIAASVLVGPDYEDFSVTPSAANDRRLSNKLGAMIVGRVARAGKPFI
ncbi:MAG: cellulose biosynthesis protein BcsS, partial [Stellaceae bacterium]